MTKPKTPEEVEAEAFLDYVIDSQCDVNYKIAFLAGDSNGYQRGRAEAINNLRVIRNDFEVGTLIYNLIDCTIEALEKAE